VFLNSDQLFVSHSKHYYNPFPCKWDVHIWAALSVVVLLLLLLLSANFNESTTEIYELEIQIVSFKKSILLWNRPWQNSLQCNWMMPCLTWLRYVPKWNGPYHSQTHSRAIVHNSWSGSKIGVFFFFFWGEFGFVYIMNKLYVAANTLVYLSNCTKGYSHASKDCTFLEGERVGQ
jgi:hypothetical protein